MNEDLKNLVNHLRRLADAEHEGSELEVTLRHAADTIQMSDLEEEGEQ
jgi:hypothetical protein